jgi:hypothetical protein
MTCYMRHMGWLIEQLGVSDDKVGRRDLDRALRSVLDLPDSAHCPEVWSAVKVLDDDGWAEVMPHLQRSLRPKGQSN